MRIKKIPILSAIIVFLGVVFCFLFFQVDGYTERSFYANSILKTAPFRKRIAHELEISPEVKPLLLSFGSENERLRIDFSYVTKSGEIVLLNKYFGALLILTPSINDRTVVWTCTGYPEKISNACVDSFIKDK